MQNEYIEQYTNAGKTSYAAMQELGAINSKAIQKLTELQFNFVTMNIENSIEQAKGFSGTTNYKDLLSTVSGFTSDYSTKLMDMTRQTTEILSESRDEVVSLIEKNLEISDKPTKIAVKRVTKKAAE